MHQLDASIYLWKPLIDICIQESCLAWLVKAPGNICRFRCQRYGQAEKVDHRNMGKKIYDLVW